MDLVRLVCYRAETPLANLVGPLLPGRADEARSFLKRAAALSADLLPEPSVHRLRIRLHSMSTWRENRALAGLCEYLNDLKLTYPGTSLVLTYAPPMRPEHAEPPTQE